MVCHLFAQQTQPAEGLGPRHQRGADQRAGRRGRGPGCPRPLGRRSDHRLQRSAIGTPVERAIRFTMLIHLPREKGYGVIARTKNGPALAGYGAATMKNSLADTITTLPAQLRRSLTWDRGKELSAHAQFKVETGVPVFFADPRSPWQRCTNRTRTGSCGSTSPRAPTCAMEQRRGAGRRKCTQQPTGKNPRLENASRGVRRSTTVGPTSR